MTWANKLAFLLLAIIIVLTTLAYGTVHQPILAGFYLLVSLLVVLWALDGFVSGAPRFSSSSLQLPLLAAAIYAAIQIIPLGDLAETAGLSGIPRTLSLNPFATQMTAVHYFALFLLFAVALVLVDSASRIRKLALLITVFGFVFAFFAILQLVLSPLKIYGIYEATSPFGSFVNRHNYAAYMEMSISLPLGLLFVGAVNKDKRLLYITAVALMGVSLLLSLSRGGLISFLASVVFLVILTTGTERKSRLVLRLALAALLFVGIVGGAILVGGETSLTRVAETAASKDLTTGRSNIWSVTLKVITSNLPFGAGLGAFGVAYTPHDTMSGLERVEQSHNDYLQVLADAGIVGLAIGAFFLFLIFVLGREAMRVRNPYRRGIALGALSGIFAILVHSIFDFVLHVTAVSVLFLMLLTLLVASRRSYDDDIDDDMARERSHRRSKAKVSSITTGRRSFPR
ncbi:MAG TPA: O-antigen ligase family protein [Pyrinomonadaceae bacterium]|nr:O-antigen ligase family protein [Pyrinomonadaceae bacterium]